MSDCIPYNNHVLLDRTNEGLNQMVELVSGTNVYQVVITMTMC